jgi:RNA polymerase sigma-70 factor (ECF subfamily)
MGLDKSEMLRLLVAERGPLLGFITSVSPDRAAAEDVFQTLVVITSEKPPVALTREKFLSWARTVARHESGRVMRRRRRTVMLDERVLDQLQDRWSVTDSSNAAQLSESLQRCLGRLTPNARGMLKLRFEESLSGEELAKALGRTVNTVYVALSRAYRALAQCIEQQSLAADELGRVP